MVEILIVIQNIIQYYSLRPLLKHIKKEGLWKFEIVLFDSVKNSTGFREIAEEAGRKMNEDGFEWKSKDIVNGKKCKICLAPYQDMVDVKYDYLIEYYYGSASSKPNPTFLPEYKMTFDAVLLHSVYDAEILSVYSKTYIVPNLRLRKVRRKLSFNSDKKTLLYLPTYGDINSINDVSQALKNIKKDYYIITKGHHGTEYLLAEGKNKDLVMNISDEYYGPSKDINELFERVDLVLSDNSGAIFDSMYTGIPVCIMAKDINKKLGDMNTLQYRMVQDGIIPYSPKSDYQILSKLLFKTLKPNVIKRQKEVAKNLFPNKTGGVKAWVKVLEKYMKDEINTDYIKLHRYYTVRNQENEKLIPYLKEQNKNYKTELDRLNHELSEKNNKLRLMELENNSYKNGKLYKLANKIYKIKEGNFRNG